jgi:hypothetical protein
MNKYQYIDHKPSRKVVNFKKGKLDKIKKRLDDIRAEQSEIYTHFKKKYQRHELEDIVSDQEMADLREEMRESGSIAAVLKQLEAHTRRRFSY